MKWPTSYGIREFLPIAVVTAWGDNSIPGLMVWMDGALQYIPQYEFKEWPQLLQVLWDLGSGLNYVEINGVGRLFVSDFEAPPIADILRSKDQTAVDWTECPEIYHLPDEEFLALLNMREAKTYVNGKCVRFNLSTPRAEDRNVVPSEEVGAGDTQSVSSQEGKGGRSDPSCD